MTELEFQSLANEGYNRIPLIAEAFADLETPLSLYLKLAQSERTARTRSCSNRWSAASASAAIRSSACRRARCCAPSATAYRKWCSDGKVVETHEGNPLEFIAAIPGALQGGAAPRPAALLRRPGRLLRLRRGALHREKAGAHARRRTIWPARHPVAADRGTGGDRQPVRQALPDRLRRSDAARSLRESQAAPARTARDAARAPWSRRSRRRACAPRRTANSPRTTTWRPCARRRNTSWPAN